MRICIVGFGFTRDRKEGVKNLVYELAERLVREGFDILIITIGKSDSIYSVKGFKVIEIKWTKSLISLISGLKKMRQKLKDILLSEPFDIVYDHFVLPGSSLFVTIPLVKKYKHIKLIKEVYNKPLKFSDMKNIFLPFESKYIRGEGIFRILLNNNIVDRYVYKHVDFLISHSTDISEGLNGFKYKQIKIGIDLKKWDKKVRVERQKNKFNVAYLGHPSLKKGIKQFIKAAKILLERNKNILIHIALSKTAEGEKNYVRMSLQLKKVFPRKVFLYGETEPLKVFKKADLIILPLLHDWGAISPPLSLLEAMGASSVVLSSKVCGVEDIIKDRQNGYLIEKADPEVIADKVENIMLNDNSSVSKKAQETARRYDWSEVTSSYKNLFRRVISIS